MLDGTTSAINLDPDVLREGAAGLTPEIAGMHCGALSWCLDELKAERPWALTGIINDASQAFSVKWNEATQQVRQSYTPHTGAEFGAIAVTLTAMRATRQLEVERIARINTGFDYFLVPIDADETEIFGTSGTQITRLEVSGTLRGSTSVMRARETERVERLQSDSSTTDARIVAVVGFGISEFWMKDIS